MDVQLVHEIDHSQTKTCLQTHVLFALYFTTFNIYLLAFTLTSVFTSTFILPLSIYSLAFTSEAVTGKNLISYLQLVNLRALYTNNKQFIYTAKIYYITRKKCGVNWHA